MNYMNREDWGKKMTLSVKATDSVFAGGTEEHNIKDYKNMIEGPSELQSDNLKGI
jgi:hypothetical protein